MIRMLLGPGVMDEITKKVIKETMLTFLAPLNQNKPNYKMDLSINKIDFFHRCIIIFDSLFKEACYIWKYGISLPFKPY